MNIFATVIPVSNDTLSVQLVGTALLILVKSELTSLIRNVEAATQKVRAESEPSLVILKLYADRPTRDVRQ